MASLADVNTFSLCFSDWMCCCHCFLLLLFLLPELSSGTPSRDMATVGAHSLPLCPPPPRETEALPRPRRAQAGTSLWVGVTMMSA